jgi:glycerol-3-phosphate acyltransferase PlsY
MEFFTGPSRELTIVCAGYALGCFSPGYYLVRLCSGQDIRTISSRSTGSTNVGRVLGRPGYIVTVLADGAKGGIALWAALHFGLSLWGTIGVMIAVVTGHIWPAQLGFHGGKGLATWFGAMVVFDYRLALILGSIAMLGPLLGLGTVSFLAAAVVSPAVAAVLGRPEVEVAGLGILVLLALIAHRDNIRAFLAERRGRKGLQA